MIVFVNILYYISPVTGFPLESVTTTDWIVSVTGLPLASENDHLYLTEFKYLISNEGQLINY